MDTNLMISDNKERYEQIKQCVRPSICVSTLCRNPNRRMLPLKYQLSLDDARQLIIAILEQLPRTTILAEDYHFIQAHCITPIFKFTDEVTFYFDQRTRDIHFRSTSSGGLTDFGSNKRRMQKISAQFIKNQQQIIANKDRSSQ